MKYEQTEKSCPYDACKAADLRSDKYIDMYLYFLLYLWNEILQRHIFFPDFRIYSTFVYFRSGASLFGI